MSNRELQLTREENDMLQQGLITLDEIIENRRAMNIHSVARAPAPLGRAPAPLGRAPAPLGRAPAPLGRAPAPLGRAPAPLGRAPAPLGRAPAPLGRAPAPLGRPQFGDYVNLELLGEGGEEKKEEEEEEEDEEEEDMSAEMDKNGRIPAGERRLYFKKCYGNLNPMDADEAKQIYLRLVFAPMTQNEYFEQLETFGEQGTDVSIINSFGENKSVNISVIRIIPEFDYARNARQLNLENHYMTPTAFELYIKVSLLLQEIGLGPIIENYGIYIPHDTTQRRNNTFAYRISRKCINLRGVVPSFPLLVQSVSILWNAGIYHGALGRENYEFRLLGGETYLIFQNMLQAMFLGNPVPYYFRIFDLAMFYLSFNNEDAVERIGDIPGAAEYIRGLYEPSRLILLDKVMLKDIGYMIEYMRAQLYKGSQFFRRYDQPSKRGQYKQNPLRIFANIDKNSSAVFQGPNCLWSITMDGILPGVLQSYNDRPAFYNLGNVNFPEEYYSWYNGGLLHREKNNPAVITPTEMLFYENGRQYRKENITPRQFNELKQRFGLDRLPRSIQGNYTNQIAYFRNPRNIPNLY